MKLYILATNSSEPYRNDVHIHIKMIQHREIERGKNLDEGGYREAYLGDTSSSYFYKRDYIYLSREC